MKLPARTVLITLLALTALVLLRNAQYLYSTPIPNTWTWWPGDETWLMAEYKQFLLTGHYVNPLAPGSVYAQSSGLIFGSCYVTAVLYAAPLLFLHGHTIDIGRSVTWLISIVTLVALWQIAKRYRVGPVLRAFGCLLLASTLCFFITSHSARSDMLIGLAVLLLAGWLPFFLEGQKRNRDLLLGLLLPASLLLNGHVLILVGPMIVYALWQAGILRNKKTLARCTIGAIGGFAVLLMIQFALLGSISITGPFTDYTPSMPLMRMLHPRAQWTNYNWRIFIARMWAPAALWTAIVIAIAILWARLRDHVRFSEMERPTRRFLILAALVVLISVYVEYYLPRYLIYALPTIVLAFLVVISFLERRLPKTSLAIVHTALGLCLALGLWSYETDALKIGTAGEAITMANETAVTEALDTIHARYSGEPRIFATVPMQAVVMDDSAILLTPVLYDWRDNRGLSRSDIWKRARIDYAIVCNQDPKGDRSVADSSIQWAEHSGGRLIFERTGPFCDIDRSYDPSNLQLLDTLRVYEFR